jgi:hypothetical protein
VLIFLNFIGIQNRTAHFQNGRMCFHGFHLKLRMAV